MGTEGSIQHWRHSPVSPQSKVMKTLVVTPIFLYLFPGVNVGESFLKTVEKYEKRI